MNIGNLLFLQRVGRLPDGVDDFGIGVDPIAIAAVERMIVERVLLLPPGAFIVRIGCFALRVVCSRILKPLLSDLMLVPLVTGDAATDRP
jgi:hypothetical protein